MKAKSVLVKQLHANDIFQTQRIHQNTFLANLHDYPD